MRESECAMSSTSSYLLAGQASELERLQLQSRVWEPSGRLLLHKIGDGRGTRALDVGCGVLGWLRVLSDLGGARGTGDRQRRRSDARGCRAVRD